METTIGIESQLNGDGERNLFCSLKWVNFSRWYGFGSSEYR